MPMPNVSLIVIGIGVGVALLALRRAVRIRVRVTTHVNDLRSFTQALAPKVAEYLRANFSGDPTQFERVAPGLVAMTRDLARERGEALDDATLCRVLSAVVAGLRLAPGARVEPALEAACAETRAA